LPYDRDFLQDNLSPEKLAELRRLFIVEWYSGEYTKEETMVGYRMSEWTFWYTIKKYADAEELEDYKDKPRTPNNPYRKFTNEEYNDVVKTFDETRGELNRRFANFEEDMHAAGRNLSPVKRKAQKKKIWDARAGVKRIKTFVENLWASAKKTKTIGKSCVHVILKKFGRYPEEKKEKEKPEIMPIISQHGISYTL